MSIWLGVWTWDVKFKNVILITFSIAKSYNTNIVSYHMYFVLQWVLVTGVQIPCKELRVRGCN
jgi:hypothetical protein